MAGKIIADQIQSTSAGTLDTKYVVNGSSKAWMHYRATTNTVLNSLNTSSVTDNATGDFKQNFVSNFSTTNASITFGKTNQLSNAGNAMGANLPNTSSLDLVVYEAGSKIDSGNNYTNVAGDLA